MSMSRDQVVAGAYVQAPLLGGGLHLITDVTTVNTRTEVVLEDAASPLTSERFAVPDAPGELGRSLALVPRTRALPLAEVMARCDLVRHGPCVEDSADPVEFGAMGTAPT